ncbi:uncharacterized protein DUF490 [Dinghuibacter silviterrae]|uniref:Uncharacterized protein DUF490 n=2 Tax=Dinghuibacter silviterrae TaxID=1539049 RepID=A0A4R8DTC1_9BACT|nr:uncharacterized protein DUF490 [Dinghuibacter silviterrae]
MTFKHLVKRTLRVMLWILSGVLTLLVVLFFLVQVPAVQQWLAKKAVAYLHRKLGTEVRLDRLRIIFPKQIVLEGLYLGDARGDTLLSAGRIQVDLSMLGLLRHRIDVSYLALDSIRAKVYRLKGDTAFNYDFILKAFASTPGTTRTSSGKGFTYTLGTLRLRHIDATYNDALGGLATHLALGNLALAAGRIDPDQMVYEVKYLRIDSTGFAYDDAQPRAQKGVDYHHLGVAGLALQTGAAGYGAGATGDGAGTTGDDAGTTGDGAGTTGDGAGAAGRGAGAARDTTGIYADIRRLAFNEQSGLTLKNLSARITYTTKETHIKDLVLQTDRSVLRNETDARYPSIDTLARHPELLYVDTRMDRSTISARDLLLFAPALEGGAPAGAAPAGTIPAGTAPAKTTPAGTAPARTAPAGQPSALAGLLKGSIYLDGQIRGSLDNLVTPGLEVRGLRKTTVRLRGTVSGLPDAARAIYDVQVLRLVTDSTDVYTLVPRGALHARLPRDVSATGRFKGTIRVFQGLVDASTSNGGVRVEGTMNLNNHAYQAKVATRALDVGYFLGQEKNVGRLTLTADARGRGFSYPSFQTDAHLRLTEGMIRGYTYTNLGLDIRYDNGKGVLYSDIDDPAVKYALDAMVDGPALHLNVRLDTIDATALHLITDTLRASGHLRADFASIKPDSLEGALNLLQANVYDGSRYLHADSIALVAHHPLDRHPMDSPPLDSQYLHLYSDAAVLDLDGRYRLTQLPAALEQTLRPYYALPGIRDTTFSPQSWNLDVLVTPTPLLLTFVPDLAGSDTIGLHTTFDSQRHDLRLSLATPAFRYGSDTVRHLKIDAVTRPEHLDYEVNAEQAMVGGQSLKLPVIRGRVEHDALYTTALFHDEEGKDWYRLAARMEKAGSVYSLSLNPDSLLLNHEVWSVSPNNLIRYDSTGLNIHDVALSYKDQSLTANSQGPDIHLRFDRFRLSTLTQFTGGDTALVSGILDGAADVNKRGVFTSDLTVKDLAVKSDTLGNLGVNVNNEVAATYAADVTLLGRATDLALKGTYDTAGKMDLALSLNAFDLAALEPFVAGQLDDIRGQLKGRMHITGTPSRFVPDGHLHFDSAVITPHLSGEPLRLSQDNIEFDDTGFNFSKFSLTDSSGNKATLDGNVYTTDYRAMRFDLTCHAGNFRLLNAAPATDRMFYGKLNLDAVVNLKGDLQTPKMDGDIHINRRTDFTYILPENDPEVVSREGVVRFVSHNDTLVKKEELATLQGLNMSANIATDSMAHFTMIIDQRNGDALKIRGRAHLNFGLDESGKTSLTGVYEVDAGQYNLTLQLLKRTFLLQRGSTITWTGDPMSALIHLVATYSLRTSPIDLVQNEISGRSATDITKFKQRLPFTVSLQMTGELLKPVITFDVTLPSNLSLQWPDVETKLSQVRGDPSELNKQVFALLLLGRFVGDNPLESGAGNTTATQMAFQSASQLLSSQLNQLAASLVKGVDLNFDLNNTQDYSTGQEQNQTDLAVTLSKSLFNDRVKVNVGSDFELQGAYPNQNASNIAGDVSVDYQLTRDGRYRVRAYRKNQYQVVVEGQVVETGVSFILTLDYNKFREIYK